MNKALPEALSDILTFYGALVSQKEEGYLEYVAPREISKKLRIPEYGRIGFESGSSDVGIIPGYYDSELFQSLKKVLLQERKMSVAAAGHFVPNTEKVIKTVSSSVGFFNATFRITTVEQGKIPYILVYFKYQALSDDTKEGLCPILINALTASTVLLSEDTAYNIIDTLKDAETAVSGNDETTVRILQSAYAASAVAIKEKLSDFTKSLERRLNRDIKRVYEYYGTLKKETRILIGKAGRNLKEDEMKRIAGKLEAIEAEQKWKIRDLVSKYVLKVDLEPVTCIRIETQSSIVGIDIKRRDQTRAFPLTYNTFLKRLDALPCEACFYPRSGYYVCDVCLHIICADCFKTCPDCGKRYCSACFTKGCPKCLKKHV